MPATEWIQKTKGFSLIELMVITAIMSILLAIAIPNYIAIRNKPYCNLAETDADNVKSAIADYFSVLSHDDLPKITDLDIVTNNPVEITGDPNGTIIITVTDISGRCPKDYQSSSEQWVGNKFIKKIGN